MTADPRDDRYTHASDSGTAAGTSEASPRRGRRRPTSVPVASRENARRNKKPKKNRLEMLKGDIVGVAILISVLLVVLIAIAVPTRNYYEGRAEIARYQDSIEAKKQQKADLEAELAKYNDPAYAKQQARRRLGMMEEGETAWRIMDPRMDGLDQMTSEKQEVVEPPKPWNDVLLDSLREVPQNPEQPPAPEQPEGQ